MNRLRVLVLGATGFIGKHVVAQLKESQWAVPIAASRRAPARGMVPDDALERRYFDATDQASMHQAMRGVDAVVNCVAGDAPTILASGKAVFAAAMEQPTPPRIIHFSSLAAYGSVCGEIDETEPLRGDLGPYSAAKAAVETLSTGTPTVILRPGIVYGPHSIWWSDRIAQLLCSGRLGDLGRRGAGCCNLIYVTDVAAAAVKALRVPGIEGLRFNLATPHAPTWNEYFRLYAHALGALPARRISSRRLLYELKVLGPALKVAEIAAPLLPRWTSSLPPAIRPWLIDLCGHDIRLRVDNAERRLRLVWTPLEVGLGETARWYLTRRVSRLPSSS